MQPPGSSGVMGLIYNKILPFLEDEQWELHFAGPSPRLASVLTEKVNCPQSRLHYTENISWSLRFSVLKNRQERRSLLYYAYGSLQVVSIAVEKLVKHDRHAYLMAGIEKIILAADAKWNYELIGGKSPDFAMLDSVATVASSINKPLLAMIVDPHGKREGQHFFPYDVDRQKQVLDQCCGAMFMSPMTRDRYVECGLLADYKAFSFTECYPTSQHLYQNGKSVLKPVANASGDRVHQHVLRCVHLGMLPEWRPIEPLFEALLRHPISLQIDFYGYVYPEARNAILSNSVLRNCMRCWRPVLHEQSHYIAQDCDVLLVVIGPRHLDNQPSKFFEYLGHSKPLIVLGPRGNPIEIILNRLEIGIYCDILDCDSIAKGIEDISLHFAKYKQAFKTNSAMIENYSDRNAAKHWSNCLKSILENASVS